MASLKAYDNGRKLIQFVALDGKRRTISLGKVSDDTAQFYKRRVERLLQAKILGEPLDRSTAQWVAELQGPMAKKFVRVGLIGGPACPQPLRPFLDAYVGSRKDIKPATKEIWGHVVSNLTEFFGAERNLQTINCADAEGFKMFLIEKPCHRQADRRLSPITVQKRLQFTRMFFAVALKRKLIDENPFADVRSRATLSRDRHHFVTREMSDRLLSVADGTWRVIIALARYGGLRCPSEVLSLTWGDIDWTKSRITVRSPKTEHHPGKDSRIMPLFPELRTVLEEAAATAIPNAKYVVEGYRHLALIDGNWRNANLRTQFERIIRKAGLEPWPRIFHSLRSSRETELVDEYPLHVVTAWLGNTPKIADKHYNQVTESHFARAAGTQGEISPQKSSASPPRAAKNSSRALQKPGTQADATDGEEPPSNGKTLDGTRVYASRCDGSRKRATISKRRGQDSNSPRKHGKNADF